MSLLNILKKNSNIRRIFGRRELVIIEKQLIGVTLRPSEKTRLSRDIRKKFEAIKLFLPFADEFQLKHGAIIKDMVSDAKDAILKSKYFPNIKRIILFGSAAEHQLMLNSDIDIAVDFVDISKQDSVKFRLDIMAEVDNRIDIQVYNVLPDKIKKEIGLKGNVLYERKNQR